MLVGGSASLKGDAALKLAMSEWGFVALLPQLLGVWC